MSLEYSPWGLRGVFAPPPLLNRKETINWHILPSLTYVCDSCKYDRTIALISKNLTFSDLGNLDSYISKVKDDKGTIICYSCNCCGKTMGRKDHMKNHIQIHFPQQEVGCEMCGVMCKNIPSLKVHISKFHRNVV